MRIKKQLFRIHEILVWIGIRICGSMPLTNGSRFGSGSFSFRHGPSRLQEKDKKSQNSKNQGFLLFLQGDWWIQIRIRIHISDWIPGVPKNVDPVDLDSDPEHCNKLQEERNYCGRVSSRTVRKQNITRITSNSTYLVNCSVLLWHVSWETSRLEMTSDICSWIGIAEFQFWGWLKDGGGILCTSYKKNLYVTRNFLKWCCHKIWNRKYLQLLRF